METVHHFDGYLCSEPKRKGVRLRTVYKADSEVLTEKLGGEGTFSRQTQISE